MTFHGIDEEILTRKHERAKTRKKEFNTFRVSVIVFYLFLWILIR